jgi:hypothetical protein
MKSAGHMTRMGKIRNTYTVLNKATEGTKQLQKQTHVGGQNQNILNT